MDIQKSGFKIGLEQSRKIFRNIRYLFAIEYRKRCLGDPNKRKSGLQNCNRLKVALANILKCLSDEQIRRQKDIALKIIRLYKLKKQSTGQLPPTLPPIRTRNPIISSTTITNSDYWNQHEYDCIENYTKVNKNYEYVHHQRNEWFLFGYQILEADRMEKLLCALANNSGGYAIIAKSIKDNCIIQQGFCPITQNMLDIFKLQVRRNLKAILRNSDLAVKIDGLPIFNQKDSFVYRVRVQVRRQNYQKCYFIEYQDPIKGRQKAVFKAYQIAGKTIQRIQPNRIYKYIHHKYIIKSKIQQTNRIMQQKHAYKNMQYIQIQKSIQINLDQFVQHQIKLKPIKFNHKNILIQILKNCIQNKQRYLKNFPEVDQNQSISVFQFNQKHNNKQQLKQCIQQIFKKTKTKYNVYKPLQEIQDQLIRYRKQKQPNIINYDIEYYKFEGKFNKFSDDLKKKIKQNDINWALLFEQAKNKVLLGTNMREQQIQEINQSVKELFKDEPIIQKMAFSKQICKNVSFECKKRRNAILFIYVVSLLSKNRPRMV